MENWQSEYLQFTLYILLTVWFIQRGSPETQGARQGGRRVRRGPDGRRARPAGLAALGARPAACALTLYANSLVLVDGDDLAAARGSCQSVTGWSDYNSDQIAHGESRSTGYRQFLGTADFWEATLQNWQSEFLAVRVDGRCFAIYLRQRGSPESKPVGAPHSATAWRR